MTALATFSIPRIASFNGHNIALIHYNDKPCATVRDVGRALGYTSDGAGFADSIRRWSLTDKVSAGGEAIAPDLREGDHVINLTGDELALFKRMDPDAAASRASGALLLTHRGVLRAAMLASTPKAVEFRDWAEDVLFAVLTTGKAPRQARAPKVERVLADPAITRARLLLAASARVKKQDPATAEAMLTEATAVLGYTLKPRRIMPADPVLQFIADRCRRGPDEAAKLSALYDAWQDWSPATDRTTSADLGRHMRRLGFKPDLHRGAGRVWMGLTLIDDPTEARIVAWVTGRPVVTMTEVRRGVGIEIAGRPLGAILRRNGYEPYRTRDIGKWSDEWRLSVPQ